MSGGRPCGIVFHIGRSLVTGRVALTCGRGRCTSTLAYLITLNDTTPFLQCVMIRSLSWFMHNGARVQCKPIPYGRVIASMSQ